MHRIPFAATAEEQGAPSFPADTGTASLLSSALLQEATPPKDPAIHPAPFLHPGPSPPQESPTLQGASPQSLGLASQYCGDHGHASSANEVRSIPAPRKATLELLFNWSGRFCISTLEALDDCRECAMPHAFHVWALDYQKSTSKTRCDAHAVRQRRRGPGRAEAKAQDQEQVRARADDEQTCASALQVICFPSHTSRAMHENNVPLLSRTQPPSSGRGPLHPFTPFREQRISAAVWARTYTLLLFCDGRSSRTIVSVETAFAFVVAGRGRRPTLRSCRRRCRRCRSGCRS